MDSNATNPAFCLSALDCLVLTYIILVSFVSQDPSTYDALMWWLGARSVATSTLWLLLAALGACVMQCQTDAWTILSPPPHSFANPATASGYSVAADHNAALRKAGTGERLSADSSAEESEGVSGGACKSGWWARWGLGRAYAGAGEDEGAAGDLEAPLLAGGSHTQQWEGQQQQREAQEAQHERVETRRGRGGERSNSCGDVLLDSLFSPLDSRAQGQWGWLDVARFMAVKHSIDLLLVSWFTVCKCVCVSVFKPQGQWGWLDVALFMAVKHSIDLLLVGGVCFSQLQFTLALPLFCNQKSIT